MIINLIGGLALLSAGVALLARAVLLSGRHPGWPSAVWWLRVVYDVAGVGLMGEGAIICSGRFAAGPLLLGVAVLFALVEVASVVNLARQRRGHYLKGVWG